MATIWKLGTELSDTARQQALNRFIHRSVGLKGIFANNEQWLANTKFAVTKDGRLNESVRHCKTIPPTCRHCSGLIEWYKGQWWTRNGTDFMCPDGETFHEPKSADRGN